MGIGRILKGIVVSIYSVIIAIFKTIFVDLFINIKDAFVYSFKKDKRGLIKRDLEAKKMVKLLDERLKRVERLLYSVFEDPTYTKSNKGKSDIKELKDEVK